MLIEAFNLIPAFIHTDFDQNVLIRKHRRGYEGNPLTGKPYSFKLENTVNETRQASSLYHMTFTEAVIGIGFTSTYSGS